ncbi:adenylate/guanylate cyclase domain-containing response regulator [filamentous cyanobacterium Phorm 46]|nr:adenylate/guanylate cyclase domain-containing response regulator [filamentous cyanobacterium Phorm 46]PSB51893.1 adenylate/guanylate cyclase domain-containing response regulator [filamentous cyanobacterium Phorm 6]
MSNKSPCIMLVDDEPANLILLEELLQLEGYTTVSALSGDEALSLARASRPDLILLDIMMPELDGFDVCDRLRNDKTLQTVPVIFLTALDDDTSRIRGLEIMADDYLTKPFNSRLLLAKVENILLLSKMRSQVVSSQFNQQVKEQSKRQIAAAWEANEYLSEKFHLFVPQQLLGRIAPQGIESIQLGNVTEEELTILFCDIRGFTAIAESQEARETFEWLNAFFTKMNDCITSHGGFIDKYLGDAIMAVFDQPNSHAINAIEAAVAMQESLQEFNAQRHKYNLEYPVNIGTGINTGIGMIGTLGSDRRMDSTVIGDVVNTASRLENLTKIYGCQIIVSENAIVHAREFLNNTSPNSKESLLLKCDLEAEKSKRMISTSHPTAADSDSPSNNYYYRWIDRVTPRGKQQAIEIYEIWAASSPDSQAKQLTQSLFDKGIQGWQSEKFVAALGYFQQLIQQNPADTVVSLYINRCQEKLGLIPTNISSEMS